MFGIDDGAQAAAVTEREGYSPHSGEFAFV